MTGRVLFYRRKGAWGFIEPIPDAPTSPDYFVHFSGLADGRKYLRPDDVVEFDPSSRNGKPSATNVRVTVPAPPSTKDGE